MKKIDIQSMSVADLQERIREEKASLHKMRFVHTLTAVENPARIRETRRQVARMLTELNARQGQTPQA